MNDSEFHSIPGVSVVTTQPVEQARKLKEALADTTIAFYSMPMIRTEAYHLNEKIKQSLNKLNQYTWAVFTSKNGVNAFFQLLNEAGLSFPANLKIAVIGTTTEITLEKIHGKADFVNSGQTSVEFLENLKSGIISKDDKILMVLGNLAPTRMQEELSEIATVDRLNVYQTIGLTDYDENLMQNIRDNRYGLLVFTSPSAFSNFYTFYRKKNSKIPLRIVSIGNITTAAIQNITKAQVFTSKTAGIDGLKNEIINYFKNKIK